MYYNRRTFMKSATALAVLSSFGAYGLELMNSKPLRVGLIGTGWYGKSDLFRLMQVCRINVISLCDVDRRQLSEAADLVQQRQENGRRPRLYTDFRKMLAEKDLDIVLIGTPDHWHTLTALAALESGAHVYLQKPISVDVMEGEALVAAAAYYGKKVQVGTQRRSTPHLTEAKKLIVDSGLLGKISHVDMCCYYHMRANGYPPIQPVPDYFDYEMWTGPAPMRPFDGLPHKRWWRTFMEYGNGLMGDMCIHMLDAVRWMLDLGWPDQIRSTGGIYVQKDGRSNITDTQTAIFEFGELNCVWQHRTWGTAADPEYPWAFILYGEKGTLKASVMQYEFIPVGEGKHIHGKALLEKDKFPEDLKEEGMELHAAPATRLHFVDFLASIDSGTDPVAGIKEGHISSASCILANIAMECGRPLRYDPERKLVRSDPEATRLLARDYRDPWVHPSYKDYL
ncbi:Gfo/Idh/MocA family protein [Zeaxanthinibacter enoshimensis]|uniref:Gfo/Idh/MocA family protein n=1 Tax=Zeaxanthinibacter enoshimensis TaxID=392009 RepID=UPI003563C28B